MLFTIDPYYGTEFFNQTLNALKNNKVKYELFVDSLQPYHFYIECQIQPVFLNYDMINSNRERNLVSLVQPLTPQNAYKFLRRDSYTGLKGLQYYTLNDQFGQMQKTKEQHIVHMSVEDAFKVSRKYPRKLWFLGRYLNNSRIIFQGDSLLLKNYLDVPHAVLQSKKGFGHITELEAQINYKELQLRDRIIKLEETPYLLNGKYIHPRVQNEYGKKFILENKQTQNIIQESW